MAEPTIKIKRSSVAGKTPTTSNLSLGELGLNTYDGKLFLKQDQGGVGVGTTIITVNPWGVGVGSTGYNTYFTAGNVGLGITNPGSKLDVLGEVTINTSVVYGSTTATTTATTANQSIFATLSATTYRSVEFLIQSTQGTSYQFEKLITVHNGTTTYDSEYANVTNENLVASYVTDISGGNIRLLVTPASASSTTYKIQYTAIKV